MRILVVEDERGIARFLQQGLEEENFRVDVVEDGAEGLKLALTGGYDLLLVDWMLPGLSGLELCHQLRRSDDHTPIIFLTAKDTVQDTVMGLQSGANDYIKKPFDFEELLARIQVQLRPRSMGKATLSLGNIAMDLDSRQVFRGEEEVSLTQKEFDLLAYLLRNKGKVCPRNRIIEKVWDIHFDYNTGVIDVYINALRKKLKLHKEEDYIQTIRGVGYIAKEIEWRP